MGKGRTLPLYGCVKFCAGLFACSGDLVENTVTEAKSDSGLCGGFLHGDNVSLGGLNDGNASFFELLNVLGIGRSGDLGVLLASVGELFGHDLLLFLSEEIPDSDRGASAAGSIGVVGAVSVISRAERDVQAKFLLRNGADHVVYPEKQVAKWAAIRYTANHVFDYIEIDEQHAIFEVEVPESWVGKSVGELDIRKKFGINILGIKRSGKTDVSITPDTVLAKDITILALGEYKALQRCFRI